MRKIMPTIYLLIFTVILLVPSVGMLIKGPSEAENGEELEIPVIYSEETGINKEYLSQLGAYFDRRFAFRRELVTAYSFLNEKIFDTSSQSGVIVGSDDWLFYTDSLADYQRTNILTSRQLHNCIRHLELINEHCDDNEIDFLFVIAANKNTLYPEYMPYYLASGEGPSNRQLLASMLTDTDIRFVDFGSHDTFTDPDAVYYFHRDSHWNNEGAAIASNSILSLLNVSHHYYVNDPFIGVYNHEGDLDRMIHPSSLEPEIDIVYDVMPEFTYASRVESNFDYRIMTSGSGSETLLMYRDSFGSALLPFMAEPFGDALFSRSNSCQINDFLSLQPDYLVVEKAERFLNQLCTAPSRLPSPVRQLPDNAVQTDITELNIAEAGDYLTITGTLPEGSYVDDSIIYIVSGDTCFEAYPVSNIAEGTEGFQALLEKNLISTDNIVFFIG